VIAVRALPRAERLRASRPALRPIAAGFSGWTADRGRDTRGESIDRMKRLTPSLNVVA